MQCHVIKEPLFTSFVVYYYLTYGFLIIFVAGIKQVVN